MCFSQCKWVEDPNGYVSLSETSHEDAPVLASGGFFI